MNIFAKYTFETLKKNRTRTLVTIVGIILSSAMLTAVTTLVYSMLIYFRDVTAYNDGNYYACIIDTTYAAADQLSADSRVNNVAVLEDIGYAKIDSPRLSTRPYLYLGGANADFFEIMPVTLTGGRLPANAGECIVPTSLKYSGVTYAVGDTVTLTLGERVHAAYYENGEPVGEYTMRQNESYQGSEGAGEYFRENGDVRTLTVVGIYEPGSYERSYCAGYTVLTVYDTALENAACNVYYNTYAPRDTYAVASALDLGENFHGVFDDNSDILLSYGVTTNKNINGTGISLIVILLLMIIGAFIALIANAFSVSVSERVKQFGLLSSVGATKKQLRSTIRCDGLFVSAVGIPLGILSGIFGIWVTLSLLAEKIASLYDSDVPFRLSLHVNFLSVFLAAALAFAVVMLSVSFPARRAAKATAIDAIRQSGEIKTVRVKRSGRAGNLPATLAGRYFCCKRKSARSVISSLTCSVVLFVAAAGFCSYLGKTVTGIGLDADSNIKINAYYSSVIAETGGMSEISKVYEDSKSVGSITDSTCFSLKFSRLYVDKSSLSSDGLKIVCDDDGKSYVRATLCVIDDESYLSYLKENGFDTEKFFYAEECNPILYNRICFYSDGRYYDYDVFKTAPGSALFGSGYSRTQVIPEYFDEDMGLFYPEETVYEDSPLNLTFITDSAPKFFTNFDNPVVFIPERMVQYIQSGSYAVTDAEYEVYMRYDTDEHAELSAAMAEYLSGTVKGSYYINDNVSDKTSEANMLFVMEVFIYGFIVLMSLVAATNVFNTVSTGVLLRRRDYAMLRSVGMTRPQMRKMTLYECLRYIIYPLLLGLPISFALLFLMWLSMRGSFEMAFYIPAAPVITTVVAVAAIAALSMTYAVGRMKNDGIVEKIKGEW